VHSINHSPSSFDVPETKAFVSENTIVKTTTLLYKYYKAAHGLWQLAWLQNAYSRPLFCRRCWPV